MHALALMKYNDRRLKLKSNSVGQFDEVVQVMLDAMLAQAKILHLNHVCAPELGLPERIAIFDVDNEPMIIINPEITQAENLAECEERCHLFPGVTFQTKRALKVMLTHNNEKGETLETTLNGDAAIYLQQFIDKFNGKLPIDFMSVLKKERFLKKYQEMQMHHCHHGCEH